MRVRTYEISVKFCDSGDIDRSEKGDVISKLLIVIARFRVKEGKLEELKRYYKKMLEIIETNEPQFIAFHGFLNEDVTKMTSIQIHPDTASMDFHMQVLRDNWEANTARWLRDSVSSATGHLPKAL